MYEYPQILQILPLQINVKAEASACRSYFLLKFNKKFKVQKTVHNNKWLEPMARLEDIKGVDQYSTQIVFGWIKSLENVLPNHNNQHYIIPELVKCWCLLYFHDKEYFVTTDDDIDINEAGNIATVTGNWSQQIFGHLSIDLNSNLKWIWTIKIINGELKHWYNYIHIGITAKGDDGNVEFYGYDAYGIKPDGSNFTTYGEKYGNNDTIKMELNMYDKNLTFYKNDESQGIAYHHINFKDNLEYKMTVSLSSKGNCVELIAFDKVYDCINVYR